MCNRPIEAWQSPDGGALIFKKPDRPSFKKLDVPCRNCMDCRIKQTMEWKVRMIHEASFHQHNQFVTLTYDDENLPYGSDLVYEHVQKFLRATRKEYGEVRFFCAGEYGSNYGRPHWHIIIYGLNLTDLEQVGRGSRGDPLYSSPKLEEIWDKGRVWVGEVNPTTCAYCAGYFLKDTGAKHAENYEILVPETGEIVQRKKPFIRMSNGGGKAKIKGGIGARWREQFLADCRKGFITFNGKPTSLPGYYLKLLESEYPEDYERIKSQRETWATSPSRRAEQTPQRRETREAILQHEEKRNRGKEKAVIAATFVEKTKRIKKKNVEKEISKLAPVAEAREANPDERPDETADEAAA